MIQNTMFGMTFVNCDLRIQEIARAKPRPSWLSPNNHLIFISILLFLSACSTITPTPTNSGIEGQVFSGPMCPVVQVGQECPDQPYQAVLTVNSPEGERIVQVQTDEEGRFKIPLLPGEYILHPQSADALPFASEQTVFVEEGKYTQVIVNYDSGVR